MRGESVYLRIKLEEFRGQHSSLRRNLQELQATLEDRDSRLEDLRAMLENRNDEVAALEERVSHTREERDRLQLRHKEVGLSLVISSEATAREAHSRFQVQIEAQRQFMLPPMTIPAYTTSNAHNQSTFPPQ